MDVEGKLNALAAERVEGEACCEQFCLDHDEDFDYVCRHYTFE
jgi:hypothetical protein